MQSIFFSLVLILLVACGKESAPTFSSKESQENTCELNGVPVECKSMAGADGLGVDLLDTIIDVSIRLTDNKIVFLEDKESTASGRRISCSTKVSEGEAYSYQISGGSLSLNAAGNTYTMTRLNEDKSGISGAWFWRGYKGEGTLILKTLTIVSPQRAILKTHCEL